MTVICINPPDENGVPYEPWRLRDSPEALAKAKAEETGPVSFVSPLRGWRRRRLTCRTRVSPKLS
jgi:hypothetical protein